MNEIKICILGGDTRMLSTARTVAEKGYVTTVYGIKGDVGKAKKCSSLKEAVRNASAVILPLPFSADGLNLFAPLWDVPLKLDTLLSAVEENTLICGGRFTKEFINSALRKGCGIFDYYKSERLAVLNAVPTAEGALAIAINETKKTVSGSKCSVLGYGRISKLLARLLKSLGADVTVFARSEEALAWIKADGYTPVPFCRLKSSLDDTDIIFNTVPAVILNEEELKNTKEGVLIIDLASAPGGVDRAAAKTLSKKVIFALSLPGKTAPESAGEIIADCVLSYVQSYAEGGQK